MNKIGKYLENFRMYVGTIGHNEIHKPGTKYQLLPPLFLCVMLSFT